MDMAFSAQIGIHRRYLSLSPAPTYKLRYRSAGGGYARSHEEILQRPPQVAHDTACSLGFFPQDWGM
ncbi:hypothetical protein ATE40_016470 [Serratia surfactantfaciens]|jgi:hypothetical protein|uniref:hypothetical protein n=1 Tax=Serratia surfactantfaciens TaxID=2741499 RepID=UPI0007C72C07|nr:hypothetical protein [Serratia surfactantfaciens]AOF00763.1 hypothetical protein ATE40_016470 [Serratia surfactantfaciens]